jgi:D-serine deaminase-like pyridoxal phosphate-dependent protein
VIIDLGAVAALRDAPLDWHHKGLPPDAATVADLIGRRVPVDGFTAPVATLDGAAVEHNLDTYAEFAASHDLLFAPHLKTSMSPELAAAQAQRGAWGFTVANVAQARVLRAFGARRILVAHGVVDPAAIAWLSAQQEEAEIFCWVDSVAGVEALAGHGIPVFVELGLPGGRTGARDIEAALSVVRAVESTDGVRLAGVAGYEGAYGDTRSPEDLVAVRAELSAIVDLAERVDAEMITAGGSAYPDLVASVFEPVRRTKILRSGAYVSHDHGHYAHLSPFALQPAFRVWGAVVSTPEPGLAFLNLGKRDVSYDLDLPTPLTIIRDGIERPVRSLSVTALNDQHTFLADPEGEVRVGDWVACGISHPCTMFERWSALPVIDSEHKVTDLVHTFF